MNNLYFVAVENKKIFFKFFLIFFVSVLFMRVRYCYSVPPPGMSGVGLPPPHCCVFCLLILCT